MPADSKKQGPADSADEQSGLVSVPYVTGQLHNIGTKTERMASSVFVMPAVLVVLCLSIFPLVVSLYLSLARLRFVAGGFEISYVGLANYRKLLFGSEQRHFLGSMENPSWVGWLIMAAIIGLMLWGVIKYARSQRFSVVGLVLRLIALVLASLGVWLLGQTLNPEGRPGTMVVTIVYVFIGIFFQYFLGLGLALLTTQRLPGRRFFRVIFLLPMMITPVGVAYMFRMMTDTSKGPLTPVWQAVGLAGWSWVSDPWGARAAVLIGDIWQWTPFMFIVLLAALEGQSVDQVEAATVDGANRWQIFRFIIWPQILPVSATVVLIRMIEAFKIIDLPNVLTGGGPGTATESMTLHAFIAWRTLDLGGSAAIAYMLLFVVTFICLSFISLTRQQAEA